MLIVSLFGFALLIFFNAISLQKIADRNHIIRDIAIPQYKISQYILRNINGFKISLIYILNAPQLTEDDRNIIANERRLSDLKTMIDALQNGGPVLDVAKVANKTLDVFTVQKSNDPEVNTLVASLAQESHLLDQAFHALTECLVSQCPAEKKEPLTADLTGSLDKLYNLVITMAVASNNQHTDQFTKLNDIITTSTSRSLLIGICIAAVLTIATLLYILLIAKPMQDILNKITWIAKGDSERSQHIAVKSNDEVGQLAHQLNIMVDNTFSLNTFKAIIEEEESTTEVNQRLAHLLCDRYHLDKLYIYEVTGTKNNMSVAYASNFDNVCSPDIFDDANYCRAKRTGHDISSLQFPEICKKFPHGDRFEHHCIPMMANGKVVGVVQLLFERGSSAEKRDEFEYLVKRATRYIKEATPVIEAKRFASALQETTLRDPMTDLYNRRFLETYSNTLVASTMRRATTVGILMCDMDFFKEVNDTYGHETGDVVLIKTAEVLKSCVRASDMVIRYGGEEFVILLIDVKNSQDILDLAERIRSTMELTVINVPDGTLKKTLSIGASEFPGDTEGFWEAIKFADVALYRAKNEGRNRVVRFSPEMWEQEKY
ncbi:MAG: diguanylate cyclase [Proteobacteria bacterium]|nr:diguanylate cyclase [Pseudomonadota bacterium]MCG2742718.1 diguanylate cyclase [Desulfobacteraceae bacterium]MDO8945638.1 diguanylate cyclase [Desulfocapsaceae bacterium]MBU3984361.1 diguanylate cyclase [Pseudomonadota bacterium]MBU4028643.1 diguanylate cyclase [Pseudomonadota bacterium]